MGGGSSKKPPAADEKDGGKLESIVPNGQHNRRGSHGRDDVPEHKPEPMPGSPRYTLAGGAPVSDEVVLDRFGGDMYSLLENDLVARRLRERRLLGRVLLSERVLSGRLLPQTILFALGVIAGHSGAGFDSLEGWGFVGLGVYARVRYSELEILYTGITSFWGACRNFGISPKITFFGFGRFWKNTLILNSV